jgi:hypothetical protein
MDKDFYANGLAQQRQYDPGMSAGGGVRTPGPFDALARVENEIGALCSRIVNITGTLVGHEPENLSGPGAPMPDGILHAVQASADATLARISQAQRQLDRLQKVLP